MQEIKIKKLSDLAEIPKRATNGDAGFDIRATSFKIDEFGNYVYGTSLSFEFSEDMVGLLFPRGSVSKYDLILSDSVGVLDSGYRGELLVKFKKLEGDKVYKIGDKIAQLVFLDLPKIAFKEVRELSESERGVGGFGSTGN